MSADEASRTIVAGTGIAAPRREAAATALVFAIALAIYLLSPVRQFLDPRFTALTAESLVTRGSWDLAPYFAAGRPGASIWQVRPAGDRWQLWYPPGTPILSAPLVGALRLAGISALDVDGRYRARGELRQQAAVAALVAAATAAVVLRLARRELPLAASVAVALATAFGTSLWSVASRALWSHGWSALLLGAAWLELLRWEDGERRRSFLLGALLAASFWVRPTDAVFAAAVTAFVAWRHRAALAGVLAAGAAGLAGFVALSWRMWGSWLPPYYRLRVDAELGGAFERLAGLLFSPTRGLLAFTPVLALVVWVLVRRDAPRVRRPLLGLAVAVVTVHLALYAVWRLWWGGATYGPRLFTDLVPILAWLGALAWRAEREAAPAPAGRAGALRRAAGLAALAVLLLWGVVAHGAGALSLRATRLVRESDRPERLWEWRRSPPLVLLGARPTVAPRAPAPLRPDARP